MTIESYWVKYVEGDNQALTGLYQPLFRKLFFIAFKFTRNETIASDIVQDLFEMLLQATIEERQLKWSTILNIDAFLSTLIKCKSMDYHKVESNRKRILSMQEQPLEEDPELYENSEKLQQLIYHLSKKEQEILQLHLAGFKNEEIAQIQDQSEKSVRNRLSESRNKLRILWKRSHILLLLLNWIN
jgi:RNA polymerase sigma-70 factor (ECF subfamily)